MFAAVPATASAAGIVVDGATATTVSTATNGHQTVNIAPAFAGVSNNTFTNFSVDAAGASLNNVGIMPGPSSIRLQVLIQALSVAVSMYSGRGPM
jgi:hypothetical protein